MKVDELFVVGYAPLGWEGSAFINSYHVHESKKGVVWEGHEEVLVEHFRQHTHIVICGLWGWPNLTMQRYVDWLSQGRRSRSGRSGGRRTNIRPTNPRKNAVCRYELRWVVQLFRSNSDDSCHPQEFCWGWRKAHFIGESPRRSVSFGKLRSQ